MNPQPWLIEWIRLAALLPAVLVGGLATGHLWPFAAGALALLVAWHLHQAIRLLRWLAEPEERALPPLASGLWSEIAHYFLVMEMRNRKRKQALSKFFKRFREVAKAFPDAIIILGRSGEIEWCNPPSRELLGLRKSEAVGHNLAERLHLPELTAYMQRGDFNNPIEIPSPVNQARILSIHIKRFGKKSYQRLVIVRDITAIHKLNQSRKDFIANISHELRTPLTVIHGYLEGLEEEAEEPQSPCAEWRRPLELMQQQTWRMQNVVNDLLTLSRIEMNPLEPEYHPINVPRLLRALIDDARTLARSSDHRFFAEIDADLWLKGNQEELQSAFGNLIYNAVRHTPPGTEVRIKWHRVRNGVQLSVGDNGQGIEEGHIPRLTERFYRVDRARSRETGGTGLGLAIVKQIVHRYEGRLGITSQPGAGSTFTCRFPDGLALDANQVG